MRRVLVIFILFTQFFAFTSAEAKAPNQTKETTAKVPNLSAYIFHFDHPVEFTRPASSYQSTNTLKDFRFLTGLASTSTFRINFPQDAQQLLKASTVYPRKLLLRLLLFPHHYFW